ncbi:hypothetical protein PW52_03300 [Tamlana sedimentorum]|uniref:Uncharacterized protein n=3 Tax=Neotamlana TaxID=3400367 RepID=A0A0D7WG11_9FLAO|nr:MULTISPECIES: hypothetical protein [Tamlana]KJD36682.1 hypothetical protein PW52_03300 [Tamlana sedimentorum]MCB4798203.1 hypothetical protein [Tamlana laminarinivorans]MCB4807216.1 hypothetical protein [Tamlana sargassicola]
MQQDIYKLYNNSFGIAFKWKDPITDQVQNKVQIIFRDMGFYFSHQEIIEFYNCVSAAKWNLPCNQCDLNCDTRNILLKTPCKQIDVAINNKELALVDDLIKGTLFQLELDDYVGDLCKN